MAKDLPEISDEELRGRVIYSMLGPAVRLARLFRVPIRELTEWLELAYYHEVKDAGLTQRESASLFQVSTRKVAQLAARLRENFFAPEREAELPRRIEYMLWAGRASEGRIRQAFEAEYDRAEVDRALERLVRQERAVREAGRTTYYTVPRSEFRLYRDNWLSKIDGLNNHLSNVADGVLARFFGDASQADERALARTLNFRVRDDDLGELRRLYEEVIFPRLAALDAKAADVDDDTTEMGLSITWAPANPTDTGEHDED